MGTVNALILHEQEHKKDRASGIELLRILSMVMIVAHHYAVHTLWTSNGEALTKPEKYIVELLASFGKVGVAIFFMITGYFLATRSKFNVRKVRRIILPTWFYSATIFLLVVVTGVCGTSAQLSWPLNSEETRSFFPLLSNAYWFITQYIVIFLLSPFLKKGLDALSDRSLAKLAVVLFTVVSVVNLLQTVINTEWTNLFPISDALYFVTFGYTLYRFRDKIPSKMAIIASASATLIILAAPFLLRFIRNSMHISAPDDFFWSTRSACTLILSGSLLILFSRLRLRSKFINYVAGLVLGVYLIHDNVWSRKLLWNGAGFFNNASYAQRGG